jgi:hypothetical protein
VFEATSVSPMIENTTAELSLLDSVMDPLLPPQALSSVLNKNVHIKRTLDLFMANRT